jgi:hypothetical protein
MKLDKFEEIMVKEFFLSRRLLERLCTKEHNLIGKMNALMQKEHNERAEHLKKSPSYEWPTDGHVFFLFALTPDLIIRYYSEITGLSDDVISKY